MDRDKLKAADKLFDEVIEVIKRPRENLSVQDIIAVLNSIMIGYAVKHAPSKFEGMAEVMRCVSQGMDELLDMEKE